MTEQEVMEQALSALESHRPTRTRVAIQFRSDKRKQPRGASPGHGLVAANQESLRLAAKGDRSPVAWVKLNNHGGIDLVLDDGLLDHQGRLALHCDLEGPIPLYTAA
jgi:hypothetical protein